MIQQVKELSAELQPKSLGQAEILMNSGIPIDKFWPAKDVTSRVAVCERGGSPEAIRIEPPIDRWVVQRAVTSSIGPAA